MTNASRQAAWRSRNPDLARAQRRERDKNRKPRNTQQRFIALDGEGGGYDDLGRQNYQLLSADDATGSINKSIQASRLSTIDCLEFILSMPRDAILVGFYFGYDTTQILRDLPPERMMRLFEESDDNKNRYVWFGQYGIDYMPRQYFRVCRIDRDTCKTIPNTARTINEVGHFFQKPFVQAIEEWEIGDGKTRAMIAELKSDRDQFTIIGKREKEYCRQECILLAQLMEKFRSTCADADIVPRYWRGAGHLAARLHEIHKTPKRATRKRAKIIDKLAQDAYYGGRFEITTIGRVKGEIYEYDISSAYPSAMLLLPCPLHSRWQKFRGNISNLTHDDATTYIADISFRHPDRQFLCGLPIREKGRLYFPKMGSGIYWSPEIRASARVGANFEIHGGYQCIIKCNCTAFEWVNELYEFRKKIGKATLGFPIKLGINGLYGKFAQRIGGAPWRDYVMAGLITSITRAKLIDAYAQAPSEILYIATDALYSRKRLTLDIGSGLGQWEETKRDGIFIVQPGIYWSGNAKPKTRGIPRSIIIEHRHLFEQVWNNWLEAGAVGDPPIVSVFVNQFIGMRAAVVRGKPELAGAWLNDLRHFNPDIGMRNIDFDWNNKRRPFGDYIRGECMVTLPFKGGRNLRSQGYDGEAITDFAAQLIEREDDPDFIPWGNSGE